MPRKKQDSDSTDSLDSSPDDKSVVQQQDIAIAAYYRAEARGFTAGNDLDDWLEAEREVMGSE